MHHLIPLVVLCAVCAGAHAQTAKIVKCTVDGKVTYTSEPCLNGDAVMMPALPPPAPDAPSTPQLERELAQQKATLNKLETARRAREAKDEKADAQASKANAAHKQKCAKLRLQKKWADEDAARASGTSAAALKLKARHEAEALALECPS
jgi:hypothetical protein